MDHEIGRAQGLGGLKLHPLFYRQFDRFDIDPAMLGASQPLSRSDRSFLSYWLDARSPLSSICRA